MPLRSCRGALLGWLSVRRDGSGVWGPSLTPEAPSPASAAVAVASEATASRHSRPLPRLAAGLASSGPAGGGPLPPAPPHAPARLGSPHSLKPPSGGGEGGGAPPGAGPGASPSPSPAAVAAATGALVALAGVAVGLMLVPAKRRSVPSSSQQGQQQHAAAGGGGGGGARTSTGLTGRVSPPGASGRLSPPPPGGARRERGSSSGPGLVAGAPAAPVGAAHPTPLFAPLPASMEPPDSSSRPGLCGCLCPSRRRVVVAGRGGGDAAGAGKRGSRGSLPPSAAGLPAPLAVPGRPPPPPQQPHQQLSDTYGLDPSIVLELEGGGGGAAGGVSPQLPEGAVSASEWMQQRRARSAAALRAAHDAALARMHAGELGASGGGLAGRTSPPLTDAAVGARASVGVAGGAGRGGAAPADSSSPPPGLQRRTSFARTVVLADGRVVRRIGRDADSSSNTLTSPGTAGSVGRGGVGFQPSPRLPAPPPYHPPPPQQRDADWDLLAAVAGAGADAAAAFPQSARPGGGGVPVVLPPPPGSSRGEPSTPPRVVPGASLPPPPPMPPQLGRLPTTPRGMLPPPPELPGGGGGGTQTVGNPLQVARALDRGF